MMNAPPVATPNRDLRRVTVIFLVHVGPFALRGRTDAWQRRVSSPLDEQSAAQPVQSSRNTR